MSNLTRTLMMGAAGASGDKVYVDDVYSTFVYNGNGGTQGIDNGIDLAGEGGLAWIKRRGASGSHALFDTERGATKRLSTDSNNPEATESTELTAFNSDGFDLGAGSTVNASGTTGTYASWTFRKAPGFFDVCEWTGNSVSGRQIAHNLGSVPGFIMVKSYVAGTGGTGWMCYHRSMGYTKAIRMDNETAATTSSAFWNNTGPTSTHFTVGNHEDINTSANGRSYIAYVFAHDSAVFGTDGDESIINCGSYTGNGSASGPTINLGFEPQWLLVVEYTSGTYPWWVVDNIRGVATGGQTTLIRASHAEAENANDANFINFNSTGFQLVSSNPNFNKSGDNYIYIAIRRPHKPPEAATEVFDDVIYNGTAGAHDVTNSLLYTDLTWIKRRTSTDPHVLTDRLRGDTKYLKSTDNSAESTWGASEVLHLDRMYSVGFQGNQTGYNNSSGQPYISWNFKRAPGFFDVVAFTAPGTNTQTINHNLGAVPEFFVVKKTSFTGSWQCYHKDLGNTKYLNLDTDAEEEVSSTRWNNTTPTATQFTLGYQFQSTRSYVVYLFSTLPGISKVSSYTGTGNAINVDCGFSAGARFILIKRTDASGDWYVYDSARGIVSGNDPYLWINSSAEEVTNTDYIDPLSSGFTVTSSAPTGLNASGGTYIFLAIA